MTAALDAITRLDEGVATPGDSLIAAVFEQHCQWAEAAHLARRDTEDLAAWLAGQCPVCVPGGCGGVCDGCFEGLP